jgi:hypothetical protein
MRAQPTRQELPEAVKKICREKILDGASPGERKIHATGTIYYCTGNTRLW